MERQDIILISGIIVSIILLIIFGLLQHYQAKFMTLSNQWIFLSILPIIVALFVGGYITKFKGFGVEFQLQQKIKALDIRANKLDISAKYNFYYNIGELYRLQKQWHDAEYSFKEAINIIPKYPSALLGLARNIEG